LTVTAKLFTSLTVGSPGGYKISANMIKGIKGLCMCLPDTFMLSAGVERDGWARRREKTAASALALLIAFIIVNNQEWVRVSGRSSREGKRRRVWRGEIE
jgi:hypothetical protein